MLRCDRPTGQRGPKLRFGIFMALAVSAAGLGLSRSANAQDGTAAPECYDALVLASAIRQTPTRIPDCGPDCIFMRWPWILKLDVEKVLQGSAALGPVTVLSIQHSYWKDDRDGLPWRLRRNKYGGFNSLHYGTKTPAVLCRKDAIPAEPLVKLRVGQTLDKLVAEGESIHGRGPKECCLANQWTGRLRLWMRDRNPFGFLGALERAAERRSAWAPPRFLNTQDRPS